MQADQQNQDSAEGIIKLTSTGLGILPAYANRHGLITGATGTGKTITLQILAEGFSSAGIPVFAADIKGDLSGISQAGSLSEKLSKRLKDLGLAQPDFQAFPTTFWDLFGQNGIPLRAEVSSLGPLLLSRLLDLNEVQEGTLNIAFKFADDNGFLILDFKDLRAVLTHISENSKEVSQEYGNVSAPSVGAIQRALLVLENQGAEKFFGDPELSLSDLMLGSSDQKGIISLLDATQLMQSPRIYSTFLLWLLSELFEQLPEVGDQDKPKLIFFFDEAHLLFTDAPEALISKVEQVVKLIRSKGVGIYFVTQNPLDIPESILAQLGNRIQHALRAYTPMEQKAVKAAASAFRQNPDINTEKAITELKTGEALISCLDQSGAPLPVQRDFILPPKGQIGPITADQHESLKSSSPLVAKYSTLQDAESAYEKISEIKKSQEQSIDDARQSAEESAQNQKPKNTRITPTEKFIGGMLSSFGREVGNKLARGVLGGILGKKG